MRIFQWIEDSIYFHVMRAWKRSLQDIDAMIARVPPNHEQELIAEFEEVLALPSPSAGPEQKRGKK